MLKRLAIILAFLPSLAFAQISYPPGGVTSVNGQTGVVALNVPLYAGGCTPTSPCPLATALANSCASGTLGYVERVSDLFNGGLGAPTNASMTCVVNGSTYNWHPNIIDNAAPATCTGTVTVTPYTSAPTMVCNAVTLGAALVFNIASSPTPWCGETVNISTANVTPILNTITLNVAGSLLKTLGVGSYSAVYTCSGATGTTGAWVVR